ncbi:TetR/AcrR family transcriptional regulator [Massilia niastensis]|uniref:TetR/AcrR family transcriptional regulator n=1 Tax=Massilia niastensis TaxID=544911 RepID=UPI0003760AD4|nr:TetR/AcrR family transcriptional regulator [Massilia niastensis]
MARTKVFDPRLALEAAMEVFWEKGYEASSTDDLLTAMKIGRQSMYDTFGDKKQLYLAALEHYIDTGGVEMRRRFGGALTPLQAIQEFLMETAQAGARDRARGCMAVNAASDFGEQDADVCALVTRAGEVTEGVLARLLAQAKERGEVAPGLDVAAAASYIHTTIRGMRTSAKAGVGAGLLSATAGFVMAALKAPAAQ